jgi:Uncharacterized protein conserved in bacteria
MRRFECQACGQTLDFANVQCESCGRALGFLPDRLDLSALEPEGDVFRPLADPERRVRYCVNFAHGACNWTVDDGSAEELCRCCRHNRTIPDLSVDGNLALWQRMERAKHLLFYSLIRLGLPLRTRDEEPKTGLAFDFLDPAAAPEPVMTGHDEGLITLNLAEADDAEREKRRGELGEPYRTLLGHFRHEVAHHFWNVLVRDAGRTDAFRAVFGDESADYGDALAVHYRDGPKPDWQNAFVSAYAASHPWEDFAETFAHYLHIVDTLETARAFGLGVRAPIGGETPLKRGVTFDPYEATAADLVEAWVPLTFAINSINRSMGQPDLYPFVLSAPVEAKLEAIRELVRAGAGQPGPAAAGG